MQLAIVTLLASLSIPLASLWRGECERNADRETCNSNACPLHAWCEICDACVLRASAVTGDKDEL